MGTQVFTDLLPAELGELWAAKSGQQKAVIAMCEAVRADDEARLKVGGPRAAAQPVRLPAGRGRAWDRRLTARLPSWLKTCLNRNRFFCSDVRKYVINNINKYVINNVE